MDDLDDPVPIRMMRARATHKKETRERDDPLSYESKMNDDGEDDFILVARMDNVRNLSTILKTINFREASQLMSHYF